MKRPLTQLGYEILKVRRGFLGWDNVALSKAEILMAAKKLGYSIAVKTY